MIASIFPRTHRRYTELPLLGTLVDDFVIWLSEQEYGLGTIRVMFGRLDQLDLWLRKRGVHHIAELDNRILEAGWTHFYRRHNSGSSLGATIRALARYLEAEGIVPPTPRLPSTPSEHLVAAYADHLLNVRGFASNTIEEHQRSVAGFLAHIGYNAEPARLHELTAADVESFVRASAEKLSRGTQQHSVAHLRSVLRFWAARDICPAGLDTLIDTPRCYRQELLPRALPPDTVQALLESIDRRTALGRRDYTLLFLIATYGLRVSEVAALTLDDLHWREGWLQVPQHKTRRALQLPLTDSVGAALVSYLREARPRVPCRALFLRTRAPFRALKPTAVSMAFARWAKRSGLPIPFSGAHCLRHAHALNLLRSGAPLKTIGDLLGHRHSDSTYGYLRLATEELREVALPLPTLLDPASPPEASS
jgi:site-specific recombinase XerD